MNLAVSGVQHTGGAGNDTLVSMENLTGSPFDDVLTGDAGNNVVSGGGGNDILEGGAGDDKLIGGPAADVASYAHAAAAVNVSLAIAVAQNTGGAGTDTLIGISGLTGSAFDDTLTGNAGTNVLSGGAGNDTLDGAAGNDTLIGGPGQDQLTGGAGNDTFVFTALVDARRATPDTITDFTLHHDKIDLSAIDADFITSGDQAFHLGATAGHVGDIVVAYDSVHGRTVIDLYVNADATPDAEIWLTGDLHTITASDFVL